MLTKGLLVDEMLVSVNDHAELGAPVAQMVITDHAVAEELQGAIDGVADDGGTNVSHVHGLRHVGRRVIHDERAGRGNLGDAQSWIAGHDPNLLRQPIVTQPQIDEAGSGNLRGAAKIADIQTRHQLARDLPRRTTQPLAQRHRHVGLIIAKSSVLRRLDQLQHRFHGFPVDKRGKSGTEPLAKRRQNVHGVRVPLCSQTDSGKSAWSTV